MLSAMSDAGHPVDWWFMYKVSERSESPPGVKATGEEYAYLDADGAALGKGLTLSPSQVGQSGGTLYNTLAPLYAPAAQAYGPVGWYFYNDEDPTDGKVISSRGHTKGVVAWDAATDSGFWLVTSTPLFPKPGAYEYPHTGLEMAQTMLCVTLQGADVARQIANQQYAAQGPHVHSASALPGTFTPPGGDMRPLLMQNKVGPATRSVTSVLPFNSRGGAKFLSIAKNKHWGLDFYNDLVGPALKENLDVETWEDGAATPGPADSDKIHKVTGMKSVNLEPLGIPYSWSERFDHAKVAISDPAETVHWVCVGDINFTRTQERRGGGTVAFQCEPLWQGLAEALSAQPKA